MPFGNGDRTTQYTNYSECETKAEPPDLHIHTYCWLLRAQTASSLFQYFQGLVYPSTEGLLGMNVNWMRERTASPARHQLWLCCSTSSVMGCRIWLNPSVRKLVLHTEAPFLLKVVFISPEQKSASLSLWWLLIDSAHLAPLCLLDKFKPKS